MSGDMVAAAVVVARQVAKWWTPTSGLRPVDLTGRPGDTIGIRGRSGTGKSTLLAILGGWCRPDTGTVRVAGRVPGPTTPWRDVALVPQTMALADEWTVAESLADGAAAGEHQELTRWLAQLDLADLAERAVTELSSGQRQRVAVARAVVARPRVLLADEPTSYQDAAHAEVVIDALHTVASTGTCLLVASHDPDILATLDVVIDLE